MDESEEGDKERERGEKADDSEGQGERGGTTQESGRVEGGGWWNLGGKNGQGEWRGEGE